MNAFNDLLARSLALAPSERAALAQLLLESLEPEYPDAEEAWAEEIQRRSDALHRGEVETCDWREAIEEIRNQLRQKQTNPKSTI